MEISQETIKKALRIALESAIGGLETEECDDYAAFTLADGTLDDQEKIRHIKSCGYCLNVAMTYKKLLEEDKK